ncbi:hypothetical protein INT43_006696 [Umbelopsis isabellina]|uniref:Uncharacterized protein n=1 Tax=Mortierella isabellina TaxID=91625 RepID=A0A8H7Q1L4_MORIS|nr:hypothetical protein INT43_006696 [Umbelopsis isabellina]
MSASLITENSNQGQLFGSSLSSSGAVASSLKLGSNHAAQRNWASLSNIEHLQRQPAARQDSKSYAYQLTSNSDAQQQQQPSLVNALRNPPNLKRAAAAQVQPTNLAGQPTNLAVQSRPNANQPATSANAASPAAQQHPFVRYTDNISQRLVLHHPDVVEFWARCPLCRTLIYCIDPKTSCYKSDAVDKHVEKLHSERIWIISQQFGAEFMWGDNSLTADVFSILLDAESGKDMVDSNTKNHNHEKQLDIKDRDQAVEKDLRRAISMEAETKFQFADTNTQPASSPRKRRRINTNQCVADSTAHVRAKCTQECYLKMIG